MSLRCMSSTHAKTPQTCYSLLHLQAWYRYDIIARMLRRVYTMRQKHATMRHALKSHYINGLIATCGWKKVGWFQLSCDSMQQSHVAQISPFTQRDFVARRISFVASCKRTFSIPCLFFYDLFKIAMSCKNFRIKAIVSRIKITRYSRKNLVCDRCKPLSV